ncbi:MAG: MerR family transcriptional regulator [Propioniciclava sp.]
MPAATRSIGQVLKVLKEDFEDVSISKIRFLEGEGLITPERAPSGYRRYSDADVSRLRYILDVQKNHYLPLKVIRQNLEVMDSGEEPPGPGAPAPTETVVPPPSAVAPAVAAAASTKRPIHITRKRLLRLSGLSEAEFAELERHDLVVPRHGTIYYGRDALTIAVVARKLTQYGMDARHLRVIKHAAEREAALLDQALAPYAHRGAQGRQAVQELLHLAVTAHAALVRSTLRSTS